MIQATKEIASRIVAYTEMYEQVEKRIAYTLEDHERYGKPLGDNWWLNRANRFKAVQSEIKRRIKINIEQLNAIAGENA